MRLVSIIEILVAMIPNITRRGIKIRCVILASIWNMTPVENATCVVLALKGFVSAIADYYTSQLLKITTARPKRAGTCQTVC